MTIPKTGTCMGDIRLTPDVVNAILSYQRKHPYDKKRILISSITTGRLILVDRDRCNDLSHTEFVFPINYIPQYKKINSAVGISFEYLYSVSVETGKQMTERELKMYNEGELPTPIERRLGNYWNVILVDDEKQMNVQEVME